MTHVPLAPLLTAPGNASRLAAIIRNEKDNPTSALNRYARMTTPAPPILLDVDGLKVLDGLHRLLVAHMAGRTHIEAIGK